jgi:hypothetical protein
MHRANTSLQGLAVIDWTFHITVIVAASVIAVFVYGMINGPAEVAPGETHTADARMLETSRP